MRFAISALIVRKYRQLQDEFLERQKQAFLIWTERVAPFSAHVCIFLPWEKHSLFWQGGRWRKRTRAAQDVSGHPGPSFIFCLPGTFDAALASGAFASGRQASGWQPLFQSPAAEIWEWRGYYEEQSLPLPLRFGLSGEEKRRVMQEARRLLGDVLAGKEARVLPRSLGARFSDKQTLDIAVWVKGRLRASVIVRDLPCSEALAKAAWRVPRDGRFVPLMLGELSETRIEITCMSDLMLPVTYGEYERKEIDAAKGYVVSYGEKIGWYLPEVHNVITFSHMRDMFAHLASEKAKVDPARVEYYHYSQFTVSDWIEKAPGTDQPAACLTLYGPVEKVSNEKVTAARVASVVERAAAWLGSIQESNGTIPTKLSARQGVIAPVNMVPLAATAHSLIVYAKYSGSDSARVIAGRVAGYLEDSLRARDEQFVADNILAYIYFFRLKLALGQSADAAILRQIVSLLPAYHANPILCLQGLSMLLDYEKSTGDTQYHAVLLEHVAILEGDFMRKRELPGEQLALYPELVAILHGLYTMTQDNPWKDKALAVCRWYVSRQQGDGAFPHSPGRRFAYTRGTGKIFEALACFPRENRQAIERVFAWLETMQYSRENTFWASDEEYRHIAGGFRHDAFNKEAWIDAAAHVILGGTRLLESKVLER